MNGPSRKIEVNAIEVAAIIAAVREYGMVALSVEIGSRFLTAEQNIPTAPQRDSADDGPETEILADGYLRLARQYRARNGGSLLDKTTLRYMLDRPEIYGFPR